MEISAIFDEWNTYAQRRVLVPRKVDLEVIERNSHSKIIAITGIRRCGKSSVLMLLAQNIDFSKKWEMILESYISNKLIV